MINFSKQIISDKVILRPIEASDFDEMSSLTQDPDMWYYFTSDLSVSSELKRWIDDALSDLRNKARLPLTVIDKSSGKIIGSTSLGRISNRDRRIEIGWTWLSQACQGAGLNTHIKHLLLQYCFDECDFVRVELKTDVLNFAARKGAIKAGFVEEGVLRSHTQVIRNRRRDSIFYAMLRDEWEEVKSNILC